jgi:hypothetical protein
MPNEEGKLSTIPAGTITNRTKHIAGIMLVGVRTNNAIVTATEPRTMKTLAAALKTEMVIYG